MPASILRVATTIALTLILVACAGAAPASPLASHRPWRHRPSRRRPRRQRRPRWRRLRLHPPSATPVPERPAGWTATGDMLANRDAHTATLLLDGRVLVTGGTTDTDVTSLAEVFDPASETWIAAGEMTEPRYNHTATLLGDGRVLVAGGVGSATAEIYDPKAGTWSRDREHEVDPKPGDGNRPPRRQGPRGRREHQPQPRRRDRLCRALRPGDREVDPDREAGRGSLWSYRDPVARWDRHGRGRRRGWRRQPDDAIRRSSQPNGTTRPAGPGSRPARSPKAAPSTPRPCCSMARSSRPDKAARDRLSGTTPGAVRGRSPET